MSTAPFRFVASAPRGLADLLARELISFGAQDVRERSTGVAFVGTIETAYRACLESRTANRVFLELGEWEVASAEEFYASARLINWSEHFEHGATLACDFSGRHPAITHTHFGALKLKDAIVDSLRDSGGFRPDISTDRPSVRVHAHARKKSKITISLDLSGESLHRRGYRGPQGEAPLKENVAAGVLLRAGWPELAAAGAEFLDPMCGSGTFVIEAALIAANIAPGLGREYFGFLGWKQHDADVWARVVSDATYRVKPDDEVTSTIRGQDRDSNVIRAAGVNAERARVDALVRFSTQPMSQAKPMYARTRVARLVESDSFSEPADDGVAADDGVRGEGGDMRGADEELAAAADTRDDITEPATTAPAFDADEDEAADSGGPALEAGRRSAGVVDSGSAAALAGGEHAAPSGGAQVPAGLVCVNPPYGVRLEEHEAAKALHRELGEILKTRFQGWSAAVLTAPELGLELGIRAHRTHTMWNGALECRLLRLKIEPDAFRERIADRGAVRANPALSDSPGARMFANRLGKNLKQMQKWARNAGVTCFRVYDADMPEYAFAIDSYKVISDKPAAGRAVASERVASAASPWGAVGSPGIAGTSGAPNTVGDGEVWLHVQEYAAPSSIEEESVRRRRAEAFSVLPEVTGVPGERIRVRTRRGQTRGNQYEKVAEQFQFHIVEEGGLKLRVNFDDYLDTGLFLDHRPTRARIREISKGKRFLNLFSYTGTVTVNAAAGGARSSVSVDLSRTYLDWAERNLGLNGFATREHELVQADCREWLADAGRGLDKYRDKYDLIFLDPPTFSNSKRMEGVLDISRDHGALIDAAMNVLAPGGLLVFSTNAQKFKLDQAVSERYDVKDISAATVPRDFARNPRIHRCYDISARGES